MKSVAFAIYLLPFAGIAFLWFIGVLRDRMGAQEDRFFATVFMGSGLLFLAMLFVAGAIAAGIIMGFGTMPDRLVESGIYAFGRATVYQLVNVYAVKMAGVFMISTSTVAILARIFPRWMAMLGRAGAAAAVEHRLYFLLGAAGLPPLGAPDQREHFVAEPEIHPRFGFLNGQILNAQGFPISVPAPASSSGATMVGPKSNCPRPGSA